MAIRILDRGCLYLKALATVVDARGESEAEVVEEIDSLGNSEVAASEVSPICWSTVATKPGRGRPIYRIQLSDFALWALLPPGEGPLAPGRGKRQSVKVLVHAHDEGMFVLSHEAWDLVRTDLDLGAFGL